MRRTSLSALIVLLVLAVGGCGEEQKAKPLGPIGVDADNPEEQAVTDAWFAYWDARVNSFFKARFDPRLGTVAAAGAVADVVRYVAYSVARSCRQSATPGSRSATSS